MNIILDIDGVIVRSRDIDTTIKHNVLRYLEFKFPDSDCKNLHRILFSNWGHTKLGLKVMCPHEDFEDFDAFVYTEETYESLKTYLADQDFSFLVQLIEHGNKIILFSNAPRRWAETVASSISPLVEIHKPAWLKPDPRAYEGVPAGVFLDDSERNLVPVLHNKKWTPILFTKSLEFHLSEFANSIRSLHT